MFVALSGPNFDGHDYLAEVAAKGAVAALVERPVAGAGLPQLLVRDTRLALGRLGAINRLAYRGPLAAITGSSGKTTVKEMLASILRVGLVGDVLATRGNLNNELGVPLTLLELQARHVAAVIELGASHVGEIAYTVGLARPQVAILNNAGTAHVGEFGGPDKIVEAKGEIIEGLPADGVAVLNRDDKAFDIWRRRAGSRRVLSFALQNPAADFHAGNLLRDARGCPAFTLRGLAGRHASSSICLVNTMSPMLWLRPRPPTPWACHWSESARAWKTCSRSKVAPSHVGRDGVRVIDDTYNANPVSMCAAVDILAAFPGRTVLVLGDMGELGEWAEQGHRDVGAYAAGKVSALFAVGPLMRHAVDAFGAKGRHFTDQASLLAALADEQGPSTTLLIKGSRSAAMDRVVAALCASTEETH